MKAVKAILAKLTMQSEDFVIGAEDFSGLQIGPAPSNDTLYYFKKERRLIKQFVLDARPQVDYLCRVTLIKKGEKFTPRLEFSVRDKTKQILQEAGATDVNVKARVSLEECHENFWKLIRFLEGLQEIEVPQGKFSLVSQDDKEIVAALRGRNVVSLKAILKDLVQLPGVSLTKEDINSLLQRRQKLGEFSDGLTVHATDEGWWQNFFEANKWIFGYGLRYEILRHEQSQPHYGGTAVDGRGGQRGDTLMSTVGDSRFTVLVEIKTPATPLLQGTAAIRNGAWSLSKQLTDAVAQIQANIQTWEKSGAETPDNRDRFEGEGVYTVRPKGIVVIGSLNEFARDRAKRETFQRFRHSIHGIDILTFDELHKRAEFIVSDQ